jgi:hypothetical protein
VSHDSVYQDEMPTRFLDRDVELLLTGQVPEDDALASFMPLVTSLRSEWSRQPSDASISTFATLASAMTRKAETTSPMPSPAPVRRPRARFTRRLALPLASIIFLSAMTGVAFAADDAAPGDSLYDLDLALENVGVGAGGVVERLTEAAKMADNGNASEALAHAAQAVAGGVDDEDVELALGGLEAAIAELDRPLPATGDTEHAALVRSKVAEMLRWMSSNSALIGDDTQPGAFGRGVAEIARQFPADLDDPADIADEAEDARGDADERADEESPGGPPEWVNPGGPPSNRPTP